jgi:hypothetical protein
MPSRRRMSDASDAVGMLLEEVQASPDLPPEARVDPNTFRCGRQRLAQLATAPTLRAGACQAVRACRG